MDGEHQITLKTRAARATFNSNQLKLIAIIAMVFDHCMIVFMPHHYAVYQFLRMPGKLTAPIMCFIIAEGYYHTSNLKKIHGQAADYVHSFLLSVCALHGI